MRTFEEIKAGITQAGRMNDTMALRMLAAEMQAIGTPEAEASACTAAGTAARLTGDYRAAPDHYQRALVVHQELGNRAGEASVTGNMIGVLMKLGRYDEASM